MTRVVFLDVGSTSHNDLDFTRLNQACDTLQMWDHTSPAQLLAHIGDAEIIISNKVVLNRATLQTLRTQLKLICVAATGTNNVDLQAAKEFGIPVTNIRNYANQSLAEHVMAFIFALRRQLPAYQRALQQGEWCNSPHFCLLNYPMPQIVGSTLAIIGYGVLGKAVEQLARAVGMHILLAEQPAKPPRAGRVAFEEAIARADVISLHCPLTEQTRHLINAERLRQMQPHALLINTARGGIVDELALLEALQQGWIAGAGIDVLAVEPPTADSPLLQANLPNLIVTPHVAWASHPARQTLLDQLADIITYWRAGEYLNRVA